MIGNILTLFQYYGEIAALVFVNSIATYYEAHMMLFFKRCKHSVNSRIVLLALAYLKFLLHDEIQKQRETSYQNMWNSVHLSCAKPTHHHPIGQV